MATSRSTGYGTSDPKINLAPVPIVANRAPSNVNDLNYDIAQIWLYNNLANSIQNTYIFFGGNTVSPWVLLAEGAGALSTLSDTSGTIVTPVADNIQLKGTANEITVTAGSGQLTWTLPSAITTPGSLTTTTSLSATTTVTAGTGITSTIGNISATAGEVSAGTTVTAGTSITATLGNITATNGNLVASTAATGLLLTPTVESGAASGTVAANGRVVSVTFTGVSIAAGATQAFTTSNTSITGSGTLLSITMVGATTGAALSIQSVANTANQSVITVENGTGASTTSANITFNYLVLN